MTVIASGAVSRRAQIAVRAEARRIQQRDVAAEVDLHQRELAAERVGAHELGVDADRRRSPRMLCEPGVERGGFVDPLMHALLSVGSVVRVAARADDS